MKNRFLLLFLTLAIGSTLAAEVGKPFLQASAALDRVLIPALMVTSGEADGDAEAEIARLAEGWQAYSASQDEVLGQAVGWSVIQNGVTRRIDMAGRLVGSDDVRMAHLMLSQVREDLVRIRSALDAGYFVDQLVRFQAAMDVVLGDGSKSLADMDRDGLVKGVSGLLDRWTGLQDEEFDADIFGFLWNDVSALENLLEAEGEAIGDLRSAVVSEDSDDLDRLAGVVRARFLVVYLIFGAGE
jgi:hypothetical protein